MNTPPDDHRQILEFRLQGESVEEIAAEVQRSEHQVRRVLHKVHEELEHRLLEIGAMPSRD